MAPTSRKGPLPHGVVQLYSTEVSAVRMLDMFTPRSVPSGDCDDCPEANTLGVPEHVAASLAWQSRYCVKSERKVGNDDWLIAPTIPTHEALGVAPVQLPLGVP